MVRAVLAFWEAGEEPTKSSFTGSFPKTLWKKAETKNCLCDPPVEKPPLVELERHSDSSEVKEKKTEDLESGKWNIFPERAPWIVTTPSRSTVYRLDAMQASTEKESAVPALPAFQPHQPPSVEAEDLQLTQEDLQKLDHLRGLRNMGVDLPGNLLQDLETLEQKEQKAASVKILSHSHLNRLKKLKGQVSTAARKIVDLDQEWAKFMNSTMDKIKEHAVLYQGCRSDMLETYNEKLQELIQVKQEVGRASQSLMSQPAEDQIVVPEASSIEEQMQKMQEVLIQSSQVGGAIDLTNDMDMEEDEPDDLEESAPLGQSSKKGSPKPQKSFRAATSPSKVAQQHLKPRTQDVREAKAKEKEENKA
eukprot:s325_g3.t1